MRIDILQLQFIDLNLRTMVDEVEKKTGFEFTLTSLYRIGDSGVHGTLPLRGIDLRCKFAGPGATIAQFVNNRWSYDPARPHKMCCKYHRTDDGAWHLHFQTHPNTRRVG